MTAIKEMVLFDTNSTAAISEEVEIGNLGDVLVVQAVNSGNCKIQGTVDGISWFDISCISASSYNISNIIKSEGIYNCAISGLKKIRGNLTSGVGTMVVSVSVLE